MYNKKYRLTSAEEFNRSNPLYLDILGSICYPVYFNVGERGWFLYECDDLYGFPHRVHTSIIRDVEYTRGNQIIVTTQNTKFTFELVETNLS